MRRNKLLTVISTMVFILGQLLIPALVFPSEVKANGSGFIKYAFNPVYLGGGSSTDEAAAGAVIYDSGSGVYKMWYTRPTVNGPIVDEFISSILDVPLGNLIDDLINGNYAAVANNDAGDIEAIIDYLAGLSTAQLESLLAGNGSVISYATSVDGINWVYQSDVLTGTTGAWDSSLVNSPSVIKNGSTYEMWYTGHKVDVDAFKTFFTDISLLSADNIKTLLNDLVSQNAGAFFTDLRAARGDSYVLTLVGDVIALINAQKPAIGHADSLDGVTWNKDAANPVVTGGSGTAWDRFGVATPSVIMNSVTYELWYTGSNLDFDQLLALLVAEDVDDVEAAILAGVRNGIGHATSTDGSNWIKDPGNPVLLKGAAGAWDSYGVFAPSVVKSSSGHYDIWYTGVKVVPGALINFLNNAITLNTALLDGINVAIGHAVSVNGTNWTKDVANPVLTRGTGTAWDKNGVGFPSVLRVDSSLLMWYTGVEVDLEAAVTEMLSGGSFNSAFSGSDIAIGLATSLLEPTLVLTPPLDTNPVGSQHTVTATFKFDDVPLSDIRIDFLIIAGPNAGDNNSSTTNGNGQASFTYIGDGGVGTDTIQATAIGETGVSLVVNQATKEWIVAPNIEVTKTVELAKDADGDGVASPGDTLKYTAIITNTGNIAAIGTTFSDVPDDNTKLVVGSVISSQGLISKGNYYGNSEVEVYLGIMPINRTATITFDVTINSPMWEHQVNNQAIVKGMNFSVVKSDDPGTSKPNDPTGIKVKTSPPVHGPGISQLGIVALMMLLGSALFWIMRRKQAGNHSR